ncbi:MAG: hypothetical protein HY681_02675 [Chloroflexi bacterium]|nr:hypothetical protein [Chloroflexota bacterium]
MAERYQQEIEDILGKIESAPPEKPGRDPNKRRAVFSRLRRILGSKGAWVSPGKVMLSAVALLLVAMLFKSSMPGFLTPMLLWGAVIIFILGYALFFVNASEPFDKRWRGRSLEGPPTAWSRWRQWLGGKK